MPGRIGKHLSDEELVEVRRGYNEGVSPGAMAERLGCSRRTIVEHYGKLRGGRSGYRLGYQKPKPEPQAKVMPDRFYHSNFELGDDNARISQD